MKNLKLVFFGLLLLPILAWGALQQVVEIEVKGLACPFCAYGLSKTFGKLPEVQNVDVSLEGKKARILLAPGQTADIEKFKKIIQDAGFTPGEARTYTEDR